MVLSRRVARFNKVVTNRVTKPIVGWAPGFGVVTHRGRRSGKEYRTPINVFQVNGAWVFALTYGPDADWVRNVLTAGHCGLDTQRRHHELTNPRVVHDTSRNDMPIVVRQILALNDVDEFLYMSPKSK